MRWSARVSISRCTARSFTDEIRLGRRPGTALAVGGSQRKLGPLTFLAPHRPDDATDGSSRLNLAAPMVGHPWCGGCWRPFVDVHHPRRTRSPPPPPPV